MRSMWTDRARSISAYAAVFVVVAIGGGALVIDCSRAAFVALGALHNTSGIRDGGGATELNVNPVEIWLFSQVEPNRIAATSDLDAKFIEVGLTSQTVNYMFAPVLNAITGATGGTTVCTGGTLLSPATFASVVQAMQGVLPSIAPENVQVVYSDSGIGNTESGGIKPFVSVNLVNLQRPFMFLQVIAGVPAQITFPSFSTTQIIGGFTPP